MKVSKRAEVDPFLVMEIMTEATRREAEGQHMIHMEVGQPGTAAPEFARANVMKHLADPMGYTLAMGRDDLRSAISAKYKREIDRDIDPSRIILTTGSSAAFQLAFITLFDADERVGIAEPGYPSYRNILKALSLNPVGIVTEIENGFQPIPSDIDARDMDGVLVASPANPTGTVLSELKLRALIEKAESEKVPFISDEIYHGLTYENRATSALEINDSSLIINSFSKYYSMTGWRLGWMVVPEELIKIMEPLAQNMFICPPHISQIAALGALDAHDECEANMQVYARNRTHLAKALPEIGFDKFSPADGGFYYYIDVSDICTDSRDLVRDWLGFGLAATPGWDFDPIRGGKFVRLSYARSEADIVEGIVRLKNWYHSQ